VNWDGEEMEAHKGIGHKAVADEVDSDLAVTREDSRPKEYMCLDPSTSSYSPSCPVGRHVEELE
jgi:hypothetical protein